MNILSEKGCRVGVATDEVQAIEKVTTQLYDVVLLSADINGLSSDEAVVLMKECNPKCIIVLMSSRPIHEASPLIYASLQKPFKMKQVVDLIDRIRAQIVSGNLQL